MYVVAEGHAGDKNLPRWVTTGWRAASPSHKHKKQIRIGLLACALQEATVWLHVRHQKTAGWIDTRIRAMSLHSFILPEIGSKYLDLISQEFLSIVSLDDDFQVLTATTSCHHWPLLLSRVNQVARVHVE
jgi:hypothetical protein